MKPIYNNSLLESGDNLEELDFSEVFMMVDMQPFFISEHSLSPTEKDDYHALERNIIHKLESVLENKGLIINVEYLSPYGLRRGVIKEISGILEQKKENVIQLKKFDSSLLGFVYDEEGENQQQKTKKALSIINQRKIPIQIGGIHASICVKNTATSITSYGCETRVLMGYILNLNNTIHSNKLCEVRAEYGKSSHLLDYGNKPMNLPGLSDYL